MKSQFDWKLDDAAEGTDSLNGDPGLQRSSNALTYLIVALLITAAVAGGWQISKRRLAQAEEALRRQVQALLDLEQSAFQRGDGDLFLSVQSADPAWMSAQLLPINQEVNRSGLTVSRVEAHQDRVWANVSWTNEQGSWHRIAFFQRRGDQLKQLPTDDEYWGASQQQGTGWGQLIYRQVDESWASRVVRYTNSEVERLCAAGCLAERRPFTLILAPDYAETAVPDEIRLPSPRLLALTGTGFPAPLFWEQLSQRLEAHLAPAQIRIGVPGIRDAQIMSRYVKLSRAFMGDHPDIEVTLELFDPERLVTDFAAVAAEYDGLIAAPSAAMLAAGLIKDLTDYVNTDPEFDQADFYEQIWSGTSWRGRRWLVPQSAEMPLMFFDTHAFGLAELPMPSIRWTWEEMSEDLSALVEVFSESGELSWGFLDPRMDSIYAYAYSWNSRCVEESPRPCGNPLQPDNLAAALDWFRQMMTRPNTLVDLTASSETERLYAVMNAQTSRRQAAIWVDLPLNYEFQLLMAGLGAVPFPGSDRFDGTTPLRLQGHVISQLSPRPRAVWQWLKFVSYQPPAPRLIPARPSVAAESGYWAYLPRALDSAMRSAFPFARAVTIDESTLISWDLVARVVSGELLPEEAARERPTLIWFHP